MGSSRISRRDFIRNVGIGAAALVGGSLLHLGQPAPLMGALTSQIKNPAVSGISSAHSQGGAFVPDAEISLTAVQKQVQILQGPMTTVWSYEGKLLSGSGVTVQAVPGSYLGPILRVQSGKKLRIIFHNNLTEKTIVHPHGLRLPEDCDGQPMQAIDPGQTKVYEFQVIDRAGPYWFHPHPMGRTAQQVVMGMAGLFNVWDTDEQAAVPGASTGENDIPVIIQDRVFTSGNQFFYNPNMLWGYLGDHILVNGKPDVALSLEPHAYRLRFLNGSNARTYKLAWSNNMPLKVIGTDSGLLPAAVSRNYIMLMPGERVDVWVDLAALAGQQVTLRSLAFDAGGMMGMGKMGMGGMMMGSALPMGAAFDILKINVGQKSVSNPVLGPLPPLAVQYSGSNVPNFSSPKPFVLGMGHMMTWTLNGRVYDPVAIADDEMVSEDETMAWEWINTTTIPHPMHIHNVQFQVVGRNATSCPASYATVNQGFVDNGWKDTVLVWPGERVKVAMKFGPFTGMYMYHCHILEHENMTMMRNYMIKAM